MIDSSRMPAIRNMPPYSSVSRIRMVGRSQGYGDSCALGSQVGFGGAFMGAGEAAITPSDPVSGAGDGDDDGGLAELTAQGHDGHPHHVGEGIGVLVPRLLQQLLSRDDRALAAHQDLQDRELLGGELDLLLVPE